MPQRRAFVIVLDACGAGALPDAADYGDAGTNTLVHVAELAGGLDLPVLQRLGLGSIQPTPGVDPAADPVLHGRLHALGPGKDTISGHWELMGVVTPKPLRTYPDGFPDDVIDALREAWGREVIGNVAASGTGIIEDLGEEHLRTGAAIVYTSADSVLQIAAHEEVIALDELYAMCRSARRIMTGEHAVGRVIARPFLGGPGAFRRTLNRHDYASRRRRAPTWTSCRRPGCRCTRSARSGRLRRRRDRRGAPGRRQRRPRSRPRAG